MRVCWGLSRDRGLAVISLGATDAGRDPRPGLPAVTLCPGSFQEFVGAVALRSHQGTGRVANWVLECGDLVRRRTARRSQRALPPQAFSGVSPSRSMMVSTTCCGDKAIETTRGCSSLSGASNAANWLRSREAGMK